MKSRGRWLDKYDPDHHHTETAFFFLLWVLISFVFFCLGYAARAVWVSL